MSTSAQIDVAKYIARAHRLRAEYLSTLGKSGVAHLRNLFSHKRRLKTSKV
ncbi:RSP_7527 family protein [Sulfitobacter sp. F26204]|uniref:RSP_7527 family protein n=1 Tax=Sulfitobacter sp. F26204 TaxID=2996014 RepID=UPI003A4C58E9